jgi:arginase
MCLALAVGRGNSMLARLAGATPLVNPEDVALVGRRDASEPSYGHAALSRSAILDLPDAEYWNGGADKIATAVLMRLGRAEVDGFWIHLDADLLDPSVMPAVDSPEPGGPGFDELAVLLAPLIAHPKSMGMQITLYDPSLDPERTSAKGLVGMFERVFQHR